MTKINFNTITILEGGQHVYNVHSPAFCRDGICCIHNRTDHQLRSWPQNFRGDGLMERLCRHGIGHPDPDDYLIRMKIHPGIHSCDGCCQTANTIEGELVIKELES